MKREGAAALSGALFHVKQFAPEGGHKILGEPRPRGGRFVFAHIPAAGSGPPV